MPSCQPFFKAKYVQVGDFFHETFFFPEKLRSTHLRRLREENRFMKKILTWTILALDEKRTSTPKLIQT
jgi:hypothetical protein